MHVFEQRCSRSSGRAEGHVASAEFVQTPAKLRLHIEMPPSVHTLVGMIAKTTFYYVNDAGEVASLVRIVETPEGSVVCDRKSLEKALVSLGKKNAEWWQEKLMECLQPWRTTGGGIERSESNRAHTEIHTRFGGTLLEKKHVVEVPDAVVPTSADTDNDDWCLAVCKCATPKKRRKHKPKRKGRRHR